MRVEALNGYKRPPIVILSEAKNLGLISSRSCYGNKSEMFRFAQHDSVIHETCLIETVDEIRHFYQFTVAARSSYPLWQSRSDPPNPNSQWNF